MGGGGGWQHGTRNHIYSPTFTFESMRPLNQVKLLGIGISIQLLGQVCGMRLGSETRRGLWGSVGFPLVGPLNYGILGWWGCRMEGGWMLVDVICVCFFSLIS